MSLAIKFTTQGWDDYLYWQMNDRSLQRRINELIKELMRHPFEVKGDPEPLKADLQGLWSRRIDKEHRLVYKVADTGVEIRQCRHHY